MSFLFQIYVEKKKRGEKMTNVRSIWSCILCFYFKIWLKRMCGGPSYWQCGSCSSRQVLHNVTSRLDIGDTFVCITIIFGTYINIVFNIIIILAISLPSQPPSSFSSQTLGLSLSGKSYINLYLCIINVILRIQSWLYESQRNTILVPEKTIFLWLEICNQSISMKSPAKRKWN